MVGSKTFINITVNMIFSLFLFKQGVEQQRKKIFRAYRKGDFVPITRTPNYKLEWKLGIVVTYLYNHNTDYEIILL